MDNPQFYCRFCGHWSYVHADSCVRCGANVPLRDSQA